MALLSRRGQALVDKPAFATYIGEHFARAAQAWDRVARPDGYIALSIAENRLLAGALIAQLERYQGAPGSVLGYDSMIGNEEFRTNLAAYLSRAVLGRRVEPDHLAVVNGAGTVLQLVFHALADPGEGVLVPTPSYAGFWSDLELADDLHIVTVDGRSEDGFALTPAALDEAIDGADVPVRALLFTTPSNPLGCVYSREQLEEILAWSEARQIHLVFDEVYALSVFGERAFVSGASLRPSLGDRVHVVWAFSKDFGASGLRCGVLVTENEGLRTAVDQLAYWAACSGHTQYLLSRFVADTPVVDAYVERMQRSLREAYARVSAGLRSAGVEHLAADAAFFVLCDLRPWLAESSFHGEHDLWRRILDEANVNLTPGAACRIAEPGFFRLCYAAVEPEAVDIALERIGRVLGQKR